MNNINTKKINEINKLKVNEYYIAHYAENVDLNEKAYAVKIKILNIYNKYLLIEQFSEYTFGSINRTTILKSDIITKRVVIEPIK